MNHQTACREKHGWSVTRTYCCTACMERFLLVADGMVRQSTMQALREKYGAGKWEAE